MVLPVGMRGRLTSEEWRPLIASSLIFSYAKDIRRQLSRKLARLVVLPLLLWLLGLSVIDFALGVGSSFVGKYGFEGLIILSIYVALAPLLLANEFRAYAPHGKAQFLLADRRGAELVGTEIFLKVLKKIEAVGLLDIEGKRRHSVFRDRPNIDERIENLQALATLDQ